MTTAKAVNLLALVQNEHRYVILYTDEHAADAIMQCWRWAVNPQLGFSYYDALVMSTRIRQEFHATKGA